MLQFLQPSSGLSRIMLLAVLAVLGPACGGGGGGGGGTPFTGLAAPASPSATAGEAIAFLSWAKSAGAVSYTVRRSTVPGGPYVTIQEDLIENAFTSAGLTNGTTYYFVIIAVNATGESAPSTQLAVTPASASSPPTAPTNLVATASDGQVALSWTAPAESSTFSVKRATASGGPYTTLSNPSTTFFTDLTAANGTTYFYVVSAANSLGVSPNSAQSSATPVTPAGAPASPTGLSATAGNGQVEVFWSPSTGATSYSLRRATTAGGPYGVVNTTSATTAVDSTAANGTTYFYVVTASNSAGTSSVSAEVSATPTAPAAPPAVPTGLLATAGNASVSLSWTVSPGATGYDVRRATVSGGPYTTVAGPASSFATDSSVSNGTTYFYVVRAVNGAGASADSAEVSATPIAPPAPPSAPTGLAASPGNAVVNLTWSASAGATSYGVRRATVSGGPYTLVASGLAGAAYSDASAANGTTYFYVVFAANVGGQSANSGEVSATPLAPPVAPTGLVANPGNAQVLLSWSVSATAANYRVKRATVSGGPYALIASPVANNYTDATAVNGTTYFYVVSAVNVGGESSDSGQASAMPVAPPSAPTGLTAAPGNAVVNLTWTAAAGAASYKVKRATLSGGPYSTIGTPAGAAFSDATAANGTTYYYVVSAVNAGGESADSSQASGTPLAPPAAPTGLAAVPGNGQVSLTWSAAATAATYNVKRATASGGPYVTIASSAVMNHLDSTVANGTTYYYVVSAVNVGGEGGNSAEQSALPTTLPAVPTGLAATPGNAQVGLTWNASGGATGYNVKRSTTSGSGYATIATPVTAGYTDVTAVNNTTYFYVVSALNGTGESGNSAQVSATPMLPPAIPTGLAATAGNTQVSLSWSAAANATSYTVKRSTTSGSGYVTIATPGGLGFTDTGRTNGTTYFYVVSGVNPTGESATSTEVSATPSAGVPLAPTGLVATPGNAQVSLTWNASATATSYIVKRATSFGGPYSTVGTPAGTSFINNTGLTNGTTYYYVVSAQNGTGEGANSAEMSATPVAPPAAPGTVTAVATGTSISITWSASSGAVSYSVKRSLTSGSGHVTIATPTGTNHSDPGLAPGTTYFYVVSATNAGGEGPASSEASATTAPAGPTNLVATAGNAQVSLSWTGSSGAASYSVKRATASGGPYAAIAAPAGTAHVDATAANGTTYYYVISAVNSAGESVNSVEASATPVAPPAAPTGLTATPGNAQVGLNWTASGGADSYSVKRSTTSGSGYVTVGTPTATSFTDVTAANGTTYFYVVTAVNAGGASPNSSEASATPLSPPAAPTGLTATGASGQVSLTWNASATASGYVVKRSLTNGGPYTNVTTTGATLFTDTGLSDGTTYYYVVGATNVGGASPNSAQALAVPGAFNYTLSCSFAGGTLSLIPGESRTMVVTATLVSGTPVPVSLDVSALPANVTHSFQTTPITPSYAGTQSVLTITAGANAALGSSLKIVQGDGAGLVRNFLFLLEVRSPVLLTNPAGIAIEAGGTTALVLGQEHLVRVNLTTMTTMNTIVNGFSSGFGVVLESGGATALAAVHATGAWRIIRVNVATGDWTPVALINEPYGIAIEAGGGTALVTDNANGPTGRVSRVDLTTGVVTPITLATLNQPNFLEIESGGGTALVAERGANRLIRVNLTTGAVTPLATTSMSISLDGPEGVRILPGGTQALVSGSGTNAPYIIRVDLATGTKTVVINLGGGPLPRDLALEAGGDSLVSPVGTRVNRFFLSTPSETAAPSRQSADALFKPFDVAVEAGGATALVSHQGPDDVGRFARVNLATGIVTNLATVANPRGMQIEADGTTALVCAGDPAGGSLYRITLATGVLTPIVSNSAAIDGIQDVAIEAGGNSALVTGISNSPFVSRVNLTTGAITPVATASLTPVFDGIAIEPGGLTAVVADRQLKGALRRVVVSGPGIGSVTTVTPGLRHPRGVRLEASGATALVTEGGQAVGGGFTEGRLLRINLSTGLFEVLDTPGQELRGVSVLDADHALVAGFHGRLIKISTVPAPLTLASKASGLETVGGLAVESGGTTALFVDYGSSPNPDPTLSGRLRRVDLSTGAFTTIVTGLNTPRGVAVEASGSALVTDGGPPGTNNPSSLGRLLRVTMAGSVSQIATSLSVPQGVVVEPGGLTALVAERGTGQILRVTLSDGSFLVMAGGLGSVRHLELEASGTTVLATYSGGLTRVDLTTGVPTLINGASTRYEGFAVEPGGTTALIVSDNDSPYGWLARLNLSTGAIAYLKGTWSLNAHALRLEPGGTTLLVSEQRAGTGAIFRFSKPADPFAAAPATPGGVQAMPGDSLVSLSWSPSTGAFNYTVRRATSPGGPYTVIASAIATTNMSDGGLVNGTTYFYSVSAANANGSSAFSGDASAMPAPVPPSPSGVAAAPGDAQVTLGWSAAPDATSYNVKRATSSGGPYSVIAVQPTPGYLDTPVANGTAYFYVVSASNASGQGPNSPQVSATPNVATPPSVPTGLAAVAGTGQIQLSWIASPGAAQYIVKRSTAPGGPYSTAGSTSTTVFFDVGVVNGTVYFYVVSAINAAGASANSAEVSGSPLAPPGPPATPTNLVAAAGVLQVNLAWEGSAGATSYVVRRGISPGNYTLNTPGVISPGYTDLAVVGGTTYFYAVAAVNDAGTSGNSGETSALPTAPPTPPAAPTGLAAAAGNGQVALTWTASAGAVSYSILRGTSSGGPYGTTVASGLAGSPCTDSSVINGTTYFYVVQATNTGGTSPSSNQASALPAAPPAQVTGLAATAGNAQVSLTWTAIGGATSYVVRRGATPATYVTTFSGVATNTYVDATAANGTTYYYAVAAVSAGGVGLNSSEVSAKPLAPPAAPSGLVAYPGNGQVTLTWNASSTATSYHVYRATNAGGPFAGLTVVPSLSYTDLTSVNGTTYFYIVRAQNIGGEGPAPAPAQATPSLPSSTPLPPPAIYTDPGNGFVVVSWDSSPGATSYNVKSATVSGGPYTTIGNGPDIFFLDSTVANGTVYYYVVSAVNASGESANSSQASAAPMVGVNPPTGVVATAGNGQVTISWNAVAGAEYYTVYRSPTSGGSYEFNDFVSASPSIDTFVTNGVTYYYVVTAFGTEGESGYSAEVSATPQPPIPVIPSGVMIWTGNAELKVSWNSVSGASSYNVYLATQTGISKSNFGSWPGGVRFTTTARALEVPGLSNGVAYFCVVTAQSGGGESGDSAEVTTTPTSGRVVKDLALKEYHAHAVLADGTLWSWGNNTEGELGIGTQGSFDYREFPVPVSTVSSMTKVAAGLYHNLALKSDGTVWAWGWNTSTQLGNGTYQDTNLPIQTPLANIKAISAGSWHSLALDASNQTWVWGAAAPTNRSQFYTGHPFPTGITEVSAIRGGNDMSLTLKSNGSVVSQGFDWSGQLGIGPNNYNPYAPPVLIPGFTGVTAIAAGEGFHCLAVKNDGTVLAWGTNGEGQLGIIGVSSSNTPLQVPGLNGIVQVAVGFEHSLALKNDGTVWAWGYGLSGQLGNGARATSWTPVQVSNLAGVVSIMAGRAASMALTSDGKVWSWGADNYGVLGTGTENFDMQKVPVRVWWP